ncbi:ABC transporter permease [Pontibacter chitinilyticus]|uniref:ABC transporter permease n=1 Tax=Pontibacter chitinilyticus TaxID=2674989 RepID=UPI00321B6645
MLKNYLKIAWKVLLRRKFFTFISLFGISFTLMVLMVVSSLFDHTFGPQMPERDTDRILFVNMLREHNDEIGSFMSGPHSYYFLDHHVRTLKTPEEVSINSVFVPVNSYVNNRKLALDLKYTDRAFWDVLDFNFVEGSAFSQQDVKSANRVAVINESTRNNYFGEGSPAVGKTMEVDQVKYKVVGVVEDVPLLRIQSYAEVWVPVSLRSQDFKNNENRGNYFAIIKAAKPADIPKIKAEYAQMMQEVERQAPKGTQIDSFPETIFQNFARTFLGGPDNSAVTLLYTILAGLAFLFMLLPTINLVNINISRIMERSSEIGVRKAFGATSSTIIGQFIVENIFLTLLGGLLGFGLSYLVLWLINDSGVIAYVNLGLNLRVFGIGLLLCLVFGFISGVYPAYKMSRLHAVEALKGGTK